jgi:probable HAF family extracellular repeat protein
MFDSGTGFNDTGTVVGVRFLGSFGEVVRHTPSVLNGPPDAVLTLLQGSGSSAVDLNNHGAFVGWQGPVQQRRAFVSTASGEITQLGSLGGHTSLAHAINDAGQITGFAATSATPEDIAAGAAMEEAFLYENGAMVGVGTLGGPTSIGRAINELGQIVGASSLPNREFHAFLYDASGGIQDIGIPGAYSIAYDINDLGAVAGQQYDPLGLVPPKAFLYDQTNGLRYLDDIVGHDSGWTSFQSATGINNLGQIVGTGLFDGEIHIFLITPIPEPSSLALVFVGTSPLWLWRERRNARPVARRGMPGPLHPRY